jgi:hypothetical protein
MHSFITPLPNSPLKHKIIVKHLLITNQKFSDLKFQNAKLMDHMFANKIWIRFNQSDTLQVAALGFIQGVYPRVTHRDGFRYNLEEAIHLEMTKAERSKIQEALNTEQKNDTEEGEVVKPDIELEETTRTVGYGYGNGRIKTEAFEIRVPMEIRIEIKEILTCLGKKNSVPEGRFIPYGLVQTVGAEVYKKLLRMQNGFLMNFRMIPVFGITPKALKHVFNTYDDDDQERQMTVQNYIVARDCIRGIEMTNRAEDPGKYLSSQTLQASFQCEHL